MGLDVPGRERVCFRAGGGWGAFSVVPLRTADPCEPGSFSTASVAWSCGGTLASGTLV